MALTRARDIYTVRADGIQFLMRYGLVEIICQIELENRYRQVAGPSHTIETFDVTEQRSTGGQRRM